MNMCKPVVFACLLLSCRAAHGADWYVGPNGVAANSGTKESPWDIASGLNGRKEVRSGDTIYLLEGMYRRRPNELFEVRQNNLIVATNDARPAQTKSVLLPNKYDRDRAHVVVYNWDKAATVEVDAGRFAKDGEVIELFDPKTPFGNPRATSTRRNGIIRVPIHEEFTVFLVKVRRG